MLLVWIITFSQFKSCDVCETVPKVNEELQPCFVLWDRGKLQNKQTNQKKAQEKVSLFPTLWPQ